MTQEITIRDFMFPYGTQYRVISALRHIPGVLLKLNLGSVFTMAATDEMEDSIRVQLEQVEALIGKDWIWGLDDELVSETEEDGRTIGDCLKILYINFANPNEAMLVRMAVMDLQRV